MNPDNPFSDVHYHAHELAKKVTHMFYVKAPDDKQERPRLLSDEMAQELRDLGFTVREEKHD